MYMNKNKIPIATVFFLADKHQLNVEIRVKSGISPTTWSKGKNYNGKLKEFVVKKIQKAAVSIFKRKKIEWQHLLPQESNS